MLSQKYTHISEMILQSQSLVNMEGWRCSVSLESNDSVHVQVSTGSALMGTILMNRQFIVDR